MIRTLLFCALFTMSAPLLASSFAGTTAGSGWLVPIPVGYAALGELHPPGSVRDARDANTPFRFVEGLYSLGQWISPHRLERPEQLLWFADSQPEAGHYRCRNAFADTPVGALSA